MTRSVGARGLAVAGALWLSFVGGSTAAEAQIFPAAVDPMSIEAALVQSATSQATAPGTTALTPAVPPTIHASVTYGPSYSATGVAIGRLAGPLTTDGYAAVSLASLVDATDVEAMDEEANCLATAVYFESKGEPLEGQLAVAQVVLNRAVSGRYPTTLCGVVKQHKQFSFVRAGMFPRLDANCPAWRKARAIARIAQQHLVAALPRDVLWYHANYVSPRWREALIRVEQIGAHIFYRA